jgi:hypothetical protein
MSMVGAGANAASLTAIEGINAAQAAHNVTETVQNVVMQNAGTDAKQAQTAVDMTSSLTKQAAETAKNTV